MQRKVIIALLVAIPVLISVYISFLILNKPKPTGPTATSRLPLATPTPPVVVAGLSLPSANATSAEKDIFFNAARQKAQSVTEITLSSCNPTPQIVKVAPGKQVILKNTDTRERSISVGADNTYLIPARGETKVTANFGQGVGTYAYYCDSSSDAAGILVVTDL